MKKTDKFQKALNELEAAIHAWDAEGPDDATGDPNKSLKTTAAKRPERDPIYEKALIKKLYQQLQELSKD